MRLRLRVCLVLLLLAAGCATSEVVELEPPPVEVAQQAPPQLVTEEYLRRQLDIKWAENSTLILCELMAGPVHRYPSRVTSQAQTWDVDRTVRTVCILNDAPGKQRHIAVDWAFAGHDYEADGGTVTVDSCHRLPGAGLQTTGEYQTFDNSGAIDSEHIKKTFNVTESSSTSTSFAESVQLTSGVTIEAGTDVAKVSGTLSTELGFDKSTTQDHSTTTEKGLEIEFNVEGGAIESVAGGTNNSATDCAVTIDAVADWTTITATIGLPTPLPLEEQSTTWAELGAKEPTLYGNLQLVLRGDLLVGDTMTFDESDAMYRAAMGYDVRCPDCGAAHYSGAARRNSALLADKTFRHIGFEGLRHSTSDKDATYLRRDVTKLDRECVRETFGTKGTPITDDLLDAC